MAAPDPDAVRPARIDDIPEALAHLLVPKSRPGAVCRCQTCNAGQPTFTMGMCLHAEARRQIVLVERGLTRGKAESLVDTPQHPFGGAPLLLHPPTGPRGDPGVPPANGFCIFDGLPMELVYQIAEQSPAAWNLLARAYAPFGLDTIRPVRQRIQQERWADITKLRNGWETRVCGRLQSVRDHPAKLSTTLTQVTRSWYRGGKEHRADGPARTCHSRRTIHWVGPVDALPRLLERRFRIDGQPARGGNDPTKEKYEYRSGDPAEFTWEWRADGTRDCDDDMPTSRRFGRDGSVVAEEWMRMGVNGVTRLHRDEALGPASWHLTGGSPTGGGGGKWVEYYKEGKLHRLAGPARTLESTSGVREVEMWYMEGLLDRVDGPAVTDRTKSGVVIAEQWRENGRQYRASDGLRSRTYYHSTGALRIEGYMKNRVYHRAEGAGPAVTIGHSNGTVRERAWLNHGVPDRADGPAREVYAVDGSVVLREHWRERAGIGVLQTTSAVMTGRRHTLHRNDGPAREKFVDGCVTEREWFLFGVRHRVGGPAQQLFSPAGAIEEETWATEGVVSRADGPAHRRTFSNPHVSSTSWIDVVEWRWRGKMHREGGPALVVKVRPYDDAWGEGEVLVSCWYKNGMPCAADDGTENVKSAALLRDAYFVETPAVAWHLKPPQTWVPTLPSR